MSSEGSGDREELITQIGAPLGTHGREAARAKLDALLVQDLAKALGQVSGELQQTRKQMEASSKTASWNQRALGFWTIVLSIATTAYAVAAIVPLFRAPAEGPAWLLWMDTSPIAGPSSWGFVRRIYVASGLHRRREEELRPVQGAERQDPHRGSGRRGLCRCRAANLDRCDVHQVSPRHRRPTRAEGEIRSSGSFVPNRLSARLIGTIVCLFIYV